MSTNVFGIDLGTNNIKIYSKNEGQILVEKNMIAIENKKNLFAYGDSAYEMYEKAPSNIQISYPLSCGVIADIQNMQTLVKYFVTDISKTLPKNSEYYISVPFDITDVEKRAFLDLLKSSDLKAKKVYGVWKAVADGLGLEIDVKNSQGVMVVDVGYETTEISILSLGGVVLSRLIKMGGARFDESIRNAVRKEYELHIGGKTAESIKMNLGELEAEKKAAVVYGRAVRSGLPVKREVNVDLINQCLLENINNIIDNIKLILERTPPELGADIYRHGIYLTGGASQVNHFAELVSNGTGLQVNVAAEPIKSVALGLQTIIQDDNYKTVATAFEGMAGA